MNAAAAADLANVESMLSKLCADTSEIADVLQVQSMSMDDLKESLSAIQERLDSGGGGGVSSEALAAVETALADQHARLKEALDDLGDDVRTVRKNVEHNAAKADQAATQIRDAIAKESQRRRVDQAVLLEALEAKFGKVAALKEVFPLLADLKAGQEAILAAVAGIAEDIESINCRLGGNKIDAAAAAAELKDYIAEAATASHADHEAILAVVKQQFSHLSELQATVFPMLRDLKAGQAEIKAAIAAAAADITDTNNCLKKGRIDQVRCLVLLFPPAQPTSAS
jgi:chromosome segregation ATPase